MAATSYTARDQAAAGAGHTITLYKEVGNPLQRASNADNVSGGQVSIAGLSGEKSYDYGGVDRPNTN